MGMFDRLPANLMRPPIVATVVVVLLALFSGFLSVSTRVEVFTFAIAFLVIVALFADIRAIVAKRRSSIVVPVCLTIGQYLLNRQLLEVSFLPFPLAIGLSSFPLLVMYYHVLPDAERDHFWRRARTFGLQIAFFLFAVLASQVATGSVLNRQSPFAFIYFLNAVGFFLLTCLYCTSVTEVRRLIWVLVVGGGLQVLVVMEQSLDLAGPLHWLLNLPPWGSFVHGSLGDGELFAEYMIILSVWSIGLAWFAGSLRERIVALLFALGYIFAGAATVYRSFLPGIAGSITLLVVLALSGKHPLKRKGRAVFTLAILSTVIGVFFSEVLANGIASTALSRFSEIDFSGPDAFNRARVYSAVASMAPTIPLTGLGIKHLDELSWRVGYQLISTHSIVLWALLSAGWLGLLSLVTLIVSVAVVAIRAYLAAVKQRGTTLWVSATLVATIAIFVVDQLKVDYVRSPTYAYFVWIIFGMISSLYVLTHEASRVPESIEA